MNWTDMQHAEMARRFESGGVLAVADFAVELAQARGGTGSPRDSAQGATVATLQAKVEELEKERDLLRIKVDRVTSRTWVQCTTDSNECLGGCRSLAEHDRYRHRHLISEVEELERLCTTGSDEMVRLSGVILDRTVERDAARSEVERLKAVVNEREVDRALAAMARDRNRERAISAESRLAAIRERSKTIKPDDEAPSAVRWVLEGDASNPSMPSNGLGDAPKEAKKQVLFIGDDGPEAVTRDGLRYPCCSTCTHDDAATPGHPERVKDDSADVMAIAGNVLSDPAPHGDDAELALEGIAETDAFNRGVEAMRTACLETLDEWAQKGGHSKEHSFVIIRGLIEGASP